MRPRGVDLDDAREQRAASLQQGSAGVVVRGGGGLCCEGGGLGKRLGGAGLVLLPLAVGERPEPIKLPADEVEPERGLRLRCRVGGRRGDHVIGVQREDGFERCHAGKRAFILASHRRAILPLQRHHGAIVVATAAGPLLEGVEVESSVVVADVGRPRVGGVLLEKPVDQRSCVADVGLGVVGDRGDLRVEFVGRRRP